MQFFDDLNTFSNLVFYIMVSFGFVIGIVLMVSPDAFHSLDEALQKEYGVKTRIWPKFEKISTDVVDKTLKKNTVLTGMIISVTAFILMMVFK